MRLARHAGTPTRPYPNTCSPDPGDKSPYLFSVMFQSSSSSSSSSSIGDGGGLPGWKRVEWSKQSAGISLVPATGKTAEDEDEKDSEMTLSRYKSPGDCQVSLRDAVWPAPEAAILSLSLLS
jgi:hypothetical protein